MKLFLNFFFILFFFNSSAQPLWNTITPFPRERLSNIVAPDSMHLRAIGLPNNFFYSNDGGINWNETTLNETKINLFFTTPLNGWIASDSGKMFHTIDGGLSWNVIQLPSLTRLNKMQFISDSTFFILALSGDSLFVTHDEGVSWNSYKTYAPFAYNYKLLFIDSITGWLLPNLNDSIIYHTNDGGANWIINTLPSSTEGYRNNAIQTFSDSCWYFTQYFHDSTLIYKSTDQLRSYQLISSIYGQIREIYFVNVLNGVACGDICYYTNDGGATWLTSTILPNSSISPRNMIFINDFYGWLLEYNSISKTIDGGQTWNNIYSGIGNFQKVHFTDSLHGFLSKYSGLFIMISTDGGITWIDKSTPSEIYDFHFIDSLRGWIATDSGIFFTDDGLNTFNLQYDGPIYSLSFIDDSHGFAAYPNLFLGTYQTSLINNISTPKKNIHQIDIYPNPSTGIIHIQAPYNFSEVIISDIVGETIFQQQFRSNDETIFLPEYFSGIYFIKIYFEEQVICKKIILAK